MPKAVLFDIDGTLVNSNDAHVEVWAGVFARHGYDVDREAIRGQIGKGGDLLVPSLLPGVAADDVTRLSDAHGKDYKARFLTQVRPFPGARDLVAHAREQGLKVALASSASQGELDFYLDLMGVRDLVHATTSTDDAETSKPEGDIFSVALDKLGVAAGDAVVVGDTPYDIDAAAKCGIPTVALLSGGFARGALEGAAAIYDDAADLLARWDGSPLR